MVYNECTLPGPGEGIDRRAVVGVSILRDPAAERSMSQTSWLQLRRELRCKISQARIVSTADNQDGTLPGKMSFAGDT